MAGGLVALGAVPGIVSGRSADDNRGGRRVSRHPSRRLRGGRDRGELRTAEIADGSNLAAARLVSRRTRSSDAGPAATLLQARIMHDGPCGRGLRGGRAAAGAGRGLSWEDFLSPSDEFPPVSLDPRGLHHRPLLLGNHG